MVYHINGMPIGIEITKSKQNINYHYDNTL